MESTIARMSVTAAACIAALGLAGPSPAPAATPIGVQDDHLNLPHKDPQQRLELLEKSGARVTRHDVLWSRIAQTRPSRPANPGDPAYDFERLDEVVRGLAERRIATILVVYSTPVWAADPRAPRPDNQNPNAFAPDPSQFAAFMRALAVRYGGGYIPAGDDAPLPEVRHWEIWNEPNLGAFLTPQFRAGRPVALRHYARMLRKAYPVVRRANRDAVIIAGAAGPRSSTTRTGTGSMPWLRGLAASSAPFHAYSQHIYPSSPPRAGTRANRVGFPTWGTMPRMFDELDRHRHRRGMPVYITEAGYTTAPTPFRSVQFSPAQQARFLRDIARLPVMRNPRLKAVIWFNLQDNANWPSGLLGRDPHMAPKPSWSAFRPIARLRPLPHDLVP